MNPLVGAALVQAGSQLVGGAMTTTAQNKANRENQILFHEQMRFNRDEAEKARRAQSLSSQLREMRLGGLNPADASSTLSSSPVSASSNALPDIKPQDGLGRAISSAFARMDIAQMRNLEANTRKVNEETEGVKFTNEILSSDAKFRDAVNQQHLDLESSNTKLNLNLAQRTEKMTDLECDQLRATTKVALQQLDNMSKDIEVMQATIENLASQNKLNDAKCNEIAQNIKESIAREYKTYKEAHKIDKDVEYLDNLIDQVKVSVARDNIALHLDGLDLKLMLNGGFDLRKAIIDYDTALLPIMKTNEVICPFFSVVGGTMANAAKVAGALK